MRLFLVVAFVVLAGSASAFEPLEEVLKLEAARLLMDGNGMDMDVDDFCEEPTADCRVHLEGALFDKIERGGAVGVVGNTTIMIKRPTPTPFYVER